MNEDHVPHQTYIKHNTISCSINGLCCFSIESHAYEMPKQYNETPLISIFSIGLCVEGGVGDFVFQNALPFVGGKIQSKKAPSEYKYTKKISPHALWLLVCDYRLFQLVSFGNPIESNCLHRSPLRFEGIQYLTLEIIIHK